MKMGVRETDATFCFLKRVMIPGIASLDDKLIIGRQLGFSETRTPVETKFNL